MEQAGSRDSAVDLVRSWQAKTFAAAAESEQDWTLFDRYLSRWTGNVYVPLD